MFLHPGAQRAPSNRNWALIKKHGCTIAVTVDLRSHSVLIVIMTRINSAALAHHIEVALTVTPDEVLVDLQGGDGAVRRAATSELARHLADRLDCFDIEFAEWQLPVADQPSHFAE